MADIRNKNELKRRIELFMDELDYSINKEYCMETMRMMREFIGHASHRLDCANSKIKSLMAMLREYQKLEEQGLLLRLPCKVGSTVYHIEDGYIYEFKAKSIDVRKENGEYIFCIDSMDYKAEDFGNIVFLTKEEAEQALKHTENAR